ncbi:MAG: metallophosphoesterase [Sulfolobaceae archaeon]
MDKSEVISVLKRSIEVFDTKPLLLDLGEAERVVFVGDTHTAIEVSSYVVKEYIDKVDRIIFLGDYVDRGYTGVENLVYLLKKMLENQNKIVLLRGNHESPITNKYYGFYDEVISKYDDEIYYLFVEMFAKMPYAAVINKYLCVHGGLAKGLKKVEEINNLPKNDLEPINPIALQLLWNDPREGFEGFLPSPRGDGIYLFGRDVTEKFLNENNLIGIIRGHEAVNGVREHFNGKVKTVFSSIYHGYPPAILVYNRGNFVKYLIDVPISDQDDFS